MTPEEEMDSDVKMCSAPWTRMGNLTGCYHTGTDRATWDAAEDACQNLDAQAHLVSFETENVIYYDTLQEVQYILFFARKSKNSVWVLQWWSMRKYLETQECIPVGCVPPTTVAVGGISTRPPHPPDQAPL